MICGAFTMTVLHTVLSLSLSVCLSVSLSLVLSFFLSFFLSLSLSPLLPPVSEFNCGFQWYNYIKYWPIAVFSNNGLVCSGDECTTSGSCFCLDQYGLKHDDGELTYDNLPIQFFEYADTDDQWEVLNVLVGDLRCAAAAEGNGEREREREREIERESV